MRFLSIFKTAFRSRLKETAPAETSARKEDEEHLDLRSRVIEAASAGTRAREEYEDSLARESRESLQRYIEAAPTRTREILKSVPHAVQAHFTSVHKRDTTICIMTLDSLEYGGNIHKEELDRGHLQHAAKLVFDALTEAALKPELRIGYTQGDDNSSHDKRSKVVEIHINVDANG